MKRRRWRRFAMWAGLAACGVCLALMVISQFVIARCSVMWPNRDGAGLNVGLGMGSIVYFGLVDSGDSFILPLFTDGGEWETEVRLRNSSMEDNLLFGGGAKPFYVSNRSTHVHPKTGVGWTFESRFCNAPLWIPFVVLAIPTFFLWRAERRDRRRAAAGACVACGYDLTGNVTGRCPECGTAAAPLSA